MRDDFLSGDWAANKHHFATDINKLAHGIAKAVGDSFDALNRAQFDAPWRRPTHRIRTSGLR